MQNKDLWKSILTELTTSIRKGDLLTWFDRTAILSYQDGVLTVGIPNVFARDEFLKKFYTPVLEAAKKVDPNVKEVNFHLDSKLANSDDDRPIDTAKFMKQFDTKNRKLPNKNEMKVGNTGLTTRILNFKYSLDNFIVGADTRLAHAACEAVASQPGGKYNPLFIYGGVGLGKTHLLQGTGNEILANFPNQIVIYGSAEKFTNEIVEAIKKYDTKGVRDRYRRADVLIMDDIQFFANKGRTQEEFFHTFNELFDANKQIILSSDRPPKELEGIEDRLISRFESGMIVDVHFPDYETRLAILQEKCKEHGELISSEVLDFIAQNVQNSVRELEGVLLQAIALAALENSTPTIKFVGDILRKLNREVEIKGYDGSGREHRKVAKIGSEVINIVADYFHLAKEDILGLKRNREFMGPRQICMYLLRKELNFSYEKIGSEFSGRNHSTSLHSCNLIAHQLKKDERLLRDVNAIKREMGL